MVASDKEINDLGVEFDEQDVIENKFPQQAISVMSEWVVKHKITKDVEQAKLLLVMISILAINLSMLILYFGSFYAVPKDEPPTLLVLQTDNNLPSVVQ